MDLLPGISVRVYPVGRLDQATEGLLLLTNDGELTDFLLHPSHAVPKTYLVVVLGEPSAAALAELARGIWLEDGWTAPAEVKAVMRTAAGTQFQLSIQEGRNRQIRRMCSHIGHQVIYLKRLSLGPLNLGDLERGAYRHLTAAEVATLYRAAGGITDVVQN